MNQITPKPYFKQSKPKAQRNADAAQLLPAYATNQKLSMSNKFAGKAKSYAESSGYAPQIPQGQMEEEVEEESAQLQSNAAFLPTVDLLNANLFASQSDAQPLSQLEDAYIEGEETGMEEE